MNNVGRKSQKGESGMNIGQAPSSDAAHDHAESADHEHGESMQPEDMSDAADEHHQEAHEH